MAASTARPSGAGPAGAAKPGRRQHRHHRTQMLHRTKRKPDAVKSEINVTPLVDVMLVLLIIFMVVTPMLSRGKDVELPIAVNYLAEKDDNQIIVSIDQDTLAWLGKDPVTLASLRDRIQQEMRDKKGAPIIIKADKRLSYGRVREVMEAIHDAGADTVQLATESEKGGS